MAQNNKKIKDRLYHLAEDQRNIFISSVSYIRLIITRLQEIMIAAAMHLLFLSKFFPLISWMLEGMGLISYSFSDDNKVSNKTKGAMTFIGSLVVGIAGIALWGTLTGSIIFAIPLLITGSAFILALSYLHLAYIQHFHTDSKNYFSQKSKLKGLLAHDKELKPYARIIFDFYICQYSNLKKFDTQLYLKKARSDKSLKNLNKKQLKRFFTENWSLIKSFRKSSREMSKSTNNLLLSGLYVCAGALIIAGVIMTGPIGIITAIVCISSVISIKKNEVIYTLRRMFHEWGLKLGKRETKDYKKMSDDFNYKLFSSILYTVIVCAAIVAFLNPVMTPIIIASTLSVLVSYVLLKLAFNHFSPKEPEPTDPKTQMAAKTQSGNIKRSSIKALKKKSHDPSLSEKRNDQEYQELPTSDHELPDKREQQFAKKQKS